VFGVVTRLLATRLMNCGSILGRGMRFMLLRNPSELPLGTTQPPIQWMLGFLTPGVRRLVRETYNSPHLVPRLRMCGAVPSLLCMSSWHAFGQLYFYHGSVISIHLFPSYLSFMCAIKCGGTLHYECVTVFQDVIIITL